MKLKFFYLIFRCIGILCLSYIFLGFSIKGPSAEPTWKRLFNGKDLKGWNVKINHHEFGDNYANTFRVENGMIKVRYDQYGAFNQQYGHLYYKKSFSYFYLTVEYRITGQWKSDAPSYTVSNSGIMFHSQDPKTILKDQDWPISIELQMLAGLDDGLPRPTGNMCSPGTDVVFEGKIDKRHCISSTSKTYKKEEWVQAGLIVLGDSLITHLINGEPVLQYSKPQIGGGVVNNFNPAVKLDGKLLKEGFIGLQSEGQPVDFRNIEIVNLENYAGNPAKLNHVIQKLMAQKGHRIN